MAIRFGDAIKSFSEGQQIKQKKQSDSIDALLKQAQLKEAGYDIQETPGRFGGSSQTLVRDDNYVGTKQLERQKLQTENELNQFKLNRMKGSPVFGGGAGAATFGGAPSGATPKGNLVPKTWDEYGLPSGYYDPQAELDQKKREEDQKMEFELKKPLSAEGSTKLEGARQSLEQAKAVKALANEQNFGELKKGVGKIRMATSFGLNQPGSVKGALTNFATAGLAPKIFKTSDEQKKFELAVNLIAENNLRSKTGAAAPTPEQIREEARQLLADDSFQSFTNRMDVSEKYNRGVAEGIRPGSSAQFGQQQGGVVPEWVPQEDADFYRQEIALGTSPQEIEAFFKRKAAS